MRYVFHEIFASKEDEIDWKDYCYHVARDHTYRTVSNKLLNKIDAFMAWRGPRMTTEEIIEEEIGPKLVTPKSNVVSIITGGRDGEGNWLAGLKKGAVFLSTPKSDGGCDLEQWHIKVKWEKSAILYSNFPQQRECFRAVEMLGFSRLNNLVELIREEEQELRYD